MTGLACECRAQAALKEVVTLYSDCVICGMDGGFHHDYCLIGKALAVPCPCAQENPMKTEIKCPKCGEPLYDNGTVYVHRVKSGKYVIETQACPAVQMAVACDSIVYKFHAEMEALRAGNVKAAALDKFADIVLARNEDVETIRQLRAELTKAERWEIGFRNIVTAIVGPRADFGISQIVEAVRALRKALIDAAVSLDAYGISYGGGGGEDAAVDIACLLGFDGNSNEAVEWLKRQRALPDVAPPAKGV